MLDESLTMYIDKNKILKYIFFYVINNKAIIKESVYV